jgi:hypothetical protein
MISAAELREQSRLFSDGYLMLFILICMIYAAGVLLSQRYALRVPVLPIPTLRLRWILLIGLLVRLPGMATSFWYDETFSGGMAAMSLERLAATIMYDVHPPGSYLAQWATVQLLGLNDTALRLPALIAGLLSIVVMHRLALASGLTAAEVRTSALLMALMPGAIFYSTEARGYALLTLTILAMMLAVQRGNTRLWIVSAAAAPMLHAHGYLYVAALAAVAFWRYRERWLLPMLLSCVLPALWLPVMLRQSSDVADGFWLSNPGLGAMLQFLPNMTFATQPAQSTVLIAYVLSICTTLAVLQIARRWLWQPAGIVWLAIAAGVPFMTALLSYAWQPVFLARALLPAALIWCIPLALLAHRRPAWRLVLITGLAVVLPAALFSPEAQRINFRSYVDQCRAADAVYVVSTSAGVIAAYYTRLPVYIWAEANDLNQVLPDDAKRDFGMIPVARPPDGIICVIDTDNPFQPPAARRELRRLFEQPHYSRVVLDKTTLRITITQVLNGNR